MASGFEITRTILTSCQMYAVQHFSMAPQSRIPREESPQNVRRPPPPTPRRNGHRSPAVTSDCEITRMIPTSCRTHSVQFIACSATAKRVPPAHRLQVPRGPRVLKRSGVTTCSASCASGLRDAAVYTCPGALCAPRAPRGPHPQSVLPRRSRSTNRISTECCLEVGGPGGGGGGHETGVRGAGPPSCRPIHPQGPPTL